MSPDADVLRILDANLNRAREALRVIEDYARFALDDADAAAAAKAARHELREIAAAIGGEELSAARDILSDAGRDAKTPGELERRDAEDVVRAAFARLSESARSIGEFAKIAHPAAAERAERLRYRGYELEQRMLLRGQRREKFRRVRLYVIVTEVLCRGDWRTVADAALRGGAGCIQLREKGLSDAELLGRARALCDMAHARGALFIMNDRPDIARLAGADGVHVGQDDLTVRQVRRIAGARMLVGLSTHSVEQVRAAIEQAPDYIAVGPMFATATKPQPHIPGISLLREARAMTALPLVAIGGVSAGNTGGLFAAGASAVCACSAVVSSDDPGVSAAAILRVASG